MISFRLVLLSILLVMLSACSFSMASDINPPPGYQPQVEARSTLEANSVWIYPLVPPDPNQGKAIFVENCIPCHGKMGLGDGPNAPSLPNPVIPIASIEVARPANPTDWFCVVTQGKMERSMPPFRSLSDRQRWDVVAYALSLNTSGQGLSMGEQLYLENCVDCHGAHGKGDDPRAVGQTVPDFTNQEFMAVKSADDFFQVISQGIESKMPAFQDRLTEDDRWLLTTYLRSLTFSPICSQEPDQLTSTADHSITQTVSTKPSETSNEWQTTGAILGKVVNPLGAEVPRELEVMLHAFDQAQRIFTTTTDLKEDGTFIFQGVEIHPGVTFLTSVEFDGMIYSSDVVIAKEDQTSIELPIEIYETSTDISALSIDRLHLFFEFLDRGTVRVVELYIISNNSTKTVIAPQKGQPILSFHLPYAATALEFQNGSLGERFMLTPGGFGDTLPVRPGMGEYQVPFSYNIPFSRKLELAWPVTLPIKAVVILVPEKGLQIKGDGIQYEGLRDIQGRKYHLYEGNSFYPGQEVRLIVTGRPPNGHILFNIGSSSDLLVGIVVFVLTLVISMVWLYQRYRSESDLSPARINLMDKPVEHVTENSENIMDAILTLDDLYREGMLPEEAYLQRRKELKERLREMLGSGAQDT